MKKILTTLIILIILFTFTTSVNAAEIDGYNIDGEPIDNSHLGALHIGIKYVPSQDYTLGKIEVFTGSNKDYGFSYPYSPLITQIREDDKGMPSSTALSEVYTYIESGNSETVDENGNFRRWQGEYLLKPVDLIAGKTYWIVLHNIHGQFFSTPIAKEPNEKIEFYKSHDGTNWVKNSAPYAWMIKLFDDEDRPMGQTAPKKTIVTGPTDCDTGGQYTDFIYTYSFEIPLAGKRTKYKIDWGDGIVTDWKAYSEGVTEEKIWKKPGTYQITVQAKKIRVFNLIFNNQHIYEYIGETSDPYEVEVCDFYSREVPIFQKLVNQFPIFSRIILLFNQFQLL